MLLPRSLPKVETLTPDVMALGGGAFGRWLGCEGGALINVVSALMKETLASSAALFPPSVDTIRSQQSAVCSLEDGSH